MKRLGFFKKDFASFSLLKAFSFALLLVFVSCESDDDPVSTMDKGDFVNGVFVLNQGAMNAANASVTFIGQDTVMGDLFTERNNVEVLGDVLQDMVSVDTLSFLVLNNSHSLVVVNNKDFSFVKEISVGINNPRYAVVHDGLIYVSQWGNDGEVAVVDPEKMQVINSIALGGGPEGMAVVGDHLWVANCGGYGTDNVVSVIDLSNDEVVEEITVKDNPQDLVEDANGDVWVLATGYTQYDDALNVISETPSAIHKIDASSFEIEKTFNPDETVYGKATKIAMAADGQSFYFGGGYGFPGIWEMDIAASELPGETFADITPSGMGVDPSNGDLYVGIAPNFTSGGRVEVYAANGIAVETYEEKIGIGPCNFVFVSE